MDDGVGVEQEQELRRRELAEAIHPAGEAHVLLEREEPHVRELGLDHLDGAVARRVVEHECLDLESGRMLAERGQAAVSLVTALVRDDEYRDVWAHSSRSAAAAGSLSPEPSDALAAA